jgi:hypothetical protein
MDLTGHTMIPEYGEPFIVYTRIWESEKNVLEGLKQIII